MLEPDAEAEQTGRNARALPSGASLEGRRHRAEAGCVLDQLQRALHARGVLGVRDIEGQQRPERPDVALRHGIAETGVAHALDRGVRHQPASELQRARRLALNADGKRFQSPE